MTCHDSDNMPLLLFSESERQEHRRRRLKNKSVVAHLGTTDSISDSKSGIHIFTIAGTQ